MEQYKAVQDKRVVISVWNYFVLHGGSVPKIWFTYRRRKRNEMVGEPDKVIAVIRTQVRRFTVDSVAGKIFRPQNALSKANIRFYDFPGDIQTKIIVTTACISYYD